MKTFDKYCDSFQYTEEELISYLFKMIEDDSEEFNIFAIRELKHFHSAKIIEKLIEIIINEESTRKRVAAINSLKARKPNPNIKNTLLELLTSDDKILRDAVTEILLEYRENISEELHLLKLDKLSKEVKISVIQLLGDVGDKNSIIYLSECEHFKDDKLKNIITESINKIKRKDVRLLLDEIYKQNSH